MIFQERTPKALLGTTELYSWTSFNGGRAGAYNPISFFFYRVPLHWYFCTREGVAAAQNGHSAIGEIWPLFSEDLFFQFDPSRTSRVCWPCLKAIAYIPLRVVMYHVSLLLNIVVSYSFFVFFCHTRQSTPQIVTLIRFDKQALL